MATILDELRDPNNPRSPENLTPEERAIARDLRIQEKAAQLEAQKQPLRNSRDVNSGRFAGAAGVADPRAVNEARAAAQAEAAAANEVLKAQQQRGIPRTAEPVAPRTGPTTQDFAPRTVTTSLDAPNPNAGVVERGLRKAGEVGIPFAGAAAERKQFDREFPKGTDARMQQEAIRNVSAAGDTPGTVDKITGGEVAPEQRTMSAKQTAEFNTAAEMESAAVEQRQRAAKELNQAKGAQTPNPERIAAAEATIKQADSDLKEARVLKAEVEAQPRKVKTVTATVVEELKNVKKDPVGSAERMEKAATQKAKEVIDTADAKTKPWLKSVGEKAADWRKKATSKIPGLGGGGQPSASQSVDAMVSDAPSDMPAASKSRAAAGLRTLTKLTTVVGSVNLIEDYVYNLRELGFEGANDAVFKGFDEIVAAGGQAVDEVMAGEKSAGELAGDILGGIITGALSLIPASVKKGANWMADAADALGMDVTEFRYARDSIYEWNLNQVAPGGQQALPVSNVTPTPLGYRAPPARTDLGVQPIESPLREQPPAPAPDPRLANGPPRPTIDDRGLRIRPATGGVGDITQETTFEGETPSFRGVGATRTPEQRFAEGQEAFRSTLRGIDAVRDLAATQKGVPVQYLDAVRSGSLTRDQANKLGAIQNSRAGLRGGAGQFDANKESRAQAEEARKQYLFEQGVNDSGMAVLNELGTSIGASSSEDPVEQEAVKRNFTTWAAAWAPGVQFDQLRPEQRGRITSEYSLLTHLASEGEGFWRGLNPFAAEILPEQVTNPGESILDTMLRQGTLLDIRDNNILYMGTDESGKPVELSTTLGDMPPEARTAVNTFMAQHPDRFNRGLTR